MATGKMQIRPKSTAKVLVATLALILTLSLLGTISAPNPVEATTDEVK